MYIRCAINGIGLAYFMLVDLRKTILEEEEMQMQMPIIVMNIYLQFCFFLSSQHSL